MMDSILHITTLHALINYGGKSQTNGRRKRVTAKYTETVVKPAWNGTEQFGDPRLQLIQRI